MLSQGQAMALAQQHRLARVDETAGFWHYLQSCVRLRHFAWQYSVARFMSTTIENSLGLFWEVLNPLLLSVVYYFAYGVLLGTSSDSPQFVLFLVCGVFTWRLLSQTFTSVALSSSRSRNLTSNLLFPRILVPFSEAVRNMLSAIPMLLLLYPIALLNGETPRWTWLALPLVFFVASLLALGIGVFLTPMIQRVRDIGQLLPMAVRVMMFASGVFFSVDKRFANAPELIRVLAEWNPAALMLNACRGVFIEEDMPSPAQLLWVLGLTVVSLVVGSVLFWSAERRNG